MRKVDDGGKKRKKREKNGVFSGHYVIASSLPPERRPLERRTLVPKSADLEGKGPKGNFYLEYSVQEGCIFHILRIY